jgi:hypothetical protein
MTTARRNAMFESPHRQQRLAVEKTRQYHREAHVARTLSAAGVHHGWRWRLGETLFALAGRLSPAHRTRLERPCDPPMSEGNAAA